MSTFYATFPTWKEAKSTTQELVEGGVSPDDLSLLICTNCNGKPSPIKERLSSVGDATVLVGRADDPSQDRMPPRHEDINLFTSAGTSRLSPVDTSDSRTNVDSVDQMDDSQNEAEFMISPHDGISNSAHEKDDLALTVLTGFPTASSNFSEELLDPFLFGKQNVEGLEVLEIPNVGLVVGGGALATAALDLGASGNVDLVPYLVEDGVPEEIASSYQSSFELGKPILAVAINPGELNEAAVEEIFDRHGAQDGELYDAPRY
jgi:hypothetical protein